MQFLRIKSQNPFLMSSFFHLSSGDSPFRSSSHSRQMGGRNRKKGWAWISIGRSTQAVLCRNTFRSLIKRAMVIHFLSGNPSCITYTGHRFTWKYTTSDHTDVIFHTNATSDHIWRNFLHKCVLLISRFSRWDIGTNKMLSGLVIYSSDHFLSCLGEESSSVWFFGQARKTRKRSRHFVLYLNDVKSVSQLGLEDYHEL